MKVGIPPEVQVAAEFLMAQAKAHNVHVAGFVFGTDPMCLVNFGTCTDAHQLRLYENLCGMVQRRMESGKLQVIQVGTTKQ